DLRLLDLNEVADLGCRSKLRPRPEPCEGAHFGICPDMRFDKVAERADGRSVLDDDAWADEHVRLNDHVLSDLGVVAEEDSLRRDKCRTFGHRLVAQSLLHR